MGQAVLNDRLRQPSLDNVRLVQGSHIVVPRAYVGEHAFILQNDDRRVVFMIPYETEYTLIGTTDVALGAQPAPAVPGAEEIAYLCSAASRYLEHPVRTSDVVWSYAGIRPLYDDGSANPSKVTRDYTLRLDCDSNEAPVLSVFGGKITTYRRLAEHALSRLAPWFPGLKPEWTSARPLPGGNLAGDGAEFTDVKMPGDFPWLSADLRRALVRRHGTNVYRVLSGVRNLADLGTDFGGTLYARELDYMIAHEWARTGEDVLYRRSKAGLHLSVAQRAEVAAYVERQCTTR